MLKLGLNGAAPIASFLVVGAHADDIEIGCGGALIQLLAANPGASVTWVVLSADSERAAEARLSASALLEGRAANVEIAQFRDGYLPHQGMAVKEYFADLQTRVSPDVIFCPSQGDAHQDHRFAAQLVHQTFRDHLILEYEIPKYDGDLGRPNVYVQLSRETVEKKIASIIEQFPSQANKDWFNAETFGALLRLRGIECRAPDGTAEAFHCGKLLLG